MSCRNLVAAQVYYDVGLMQEVVLASRNTCRHAQIAVIARHDLDISPFFATTPLRIKQRNVGRDGLTCLYGP